MFVRNAWYVASWSSDLLVDRPLALSILGEPIALWRSDGHVIAFEDRCVHRLAPLSLGRCEGAKLRCMYHGLVYAADGKCVEIPGQDLVPPQARVRTYPAVEKHSWVWVWMGDPDKADDALIPPAIGLDHADYVLGAGTLDYDAGAQLIHDNLLDFSHVSFVHANSFGAGMEFAETAPHWTSIPRGMRYTRWTENVHRPEGPPFMKTAEPVDDYQTYDFLIPGVLLMYIGSFAAGTAKACEYGAPDLSKAVGFVSFTNQAVIPTGDKTARYFFSVGPHRSFGDESVRDFLVAMTNQAFAEDKLMIESQQKIIDRTPNPRLMPTTHDRATTQFTRLVERLVREEERSAS